MARRITCAAWPDHALWVELEAVEPPSAVSSSPKTLASVDWSDVSLLESEEESEEAMPPPPW
jgi:hypothetical protein